MVDEYKKVKKDEAYRDGAESLGLEFFLAEDRLVHQTWFVGKRAAEKFIAERV